MPEYKKPQCLPVLSKTRLLAFVLIPVLWLITGCSTALQSEAYDLAPLSEMHPLVQAAPISVQQAYQFAHSNPETLKHIPCYCGCGAMGHDSNYACYVNEANGDLAFDNHALGCSICVDITIDVMRMMDDGQEFNVIQTYIDNKYSAFGPSNIVP
jgi:hypothetical protein